MKKQNDLVALTQTEIMLILAVVVMLLLMAKDSDLTRVCADYPELCTSVLGYEPQEESALGQEGDESESGSGVEEEVPPDPDEEVSETLVEGGGGKQESGLGSAGASATSVIELPPHLAVKESGSEEGDVSVAEMEALQKENESLQEENNALRRLLRAEQLKAHQLKEEEKEQSDKAGVEVKQGTNSGIRGQIGCVPCWLGDGNPRYYYALDITYYPDDDTFLISPHRHLESGAAPVRKAMDGELSMLSFPPSGRVDGQTLLRYSQNVLNAKRSLYGNNGCSLPVTINEEATGKIIKLVRDTAGFCPILR